ncbi:hypothetical protein P692DRAFT_20829771 [Suillus brevipes Sb2]|nr:hypothetical protein P692DRAFT_20829771 [Suillus brevipes Sb2]
MSESHAKTDLNDGSSSESSSSVPDGTAYAKPPKREPKDDILSSSLAQNMRNRRCLAGR